MVTPGTDVGNETLRGRSTVNLNACKGEGKVERVSTKMAVAMTHNQLQMLIAAIQGGGGEGAAGAPVKQNSI